LSIKYLNEIIARPSPDSLTELVLVGNSSIGNSLVYELLKQLDTFSNLTKLTLSKFKLSFGADGPLNKNTKMLNSYLQKMTDRPPGNLQLHILTHLELSYCSLNPYQLSEVTNILKENSNLQFLSLAGNFLNPIHMNSNQ
jgi:hypothetical protein